MINAVQKKQAQQLFNAGLKAQQAGDLKAARRSFEQGLKLDPGQPDALFLLGQLLFELGEAFTGEKLAWQALAAEPQSGQYWYGLGVQYFKAGRFAEAKPAFAAALRCTPADVAYHYAQALNLTQLCAPHALDVTLNASSSGSLSTTSSTEAEALTAAIAGWQSFLHLRPAAAQAIEACENLARLCLDSARDAEAFTALQQWLELEPNSRAFALRADLYERRGELEAALGDRLAAAQVQPDNGLLRGQLALSLMRTGHVAEALEQFDEAVLLAPNRVDLQFNRGLAYARAEQPEQACVAYEQALAASTSPAEQPPILLSLASQYADWQRYDEAEALYQQAIGLNPGYATAHFNLGMLWLDVGRRLDALTALQQAADLAPQNGLIAAHLAFQKMHLCRWDGLEQLTQRMFDSISALDHPARHGQDIPPFIVLAVPGTSPAMQRRAAEQHSQYLLQAAPQSLTPRLLAAPDLTAKLADDAQTSAQQRRLRVGYLSADFKSHATVYLMIEMLEAHDRQRVEIFAFSYGVDDNSPTRQRLIAAVEHFEDLAGLPDSAAKERIAAQQLDILIDLKGYTEGNRSIWLKDRLAPIQINWLGYPGTMGAPWIDYVLADAVLAPLENQWMYQEKLLYLPGCYQPNARQRECAPASIRAQEGLPDEALVLCSFNQTYKITAEVFALWLSVLRQVPQAVLWLWASNPWAEDELRKVATVAGVAAERLIFAEGRAQAAHLARLPLADLALDTFPCNGHTTTSDALWAGVPVLTWQGEAFAARVAASLLSACDLDELIATTPEAYEQLILRFCCDETWRQNLRTTTQALREHGEIFKAEKFARKLEEVLINLAQCGVNGVDFGRT